MLEQISKWIILWNMQQYFSLFIHDICLMIHNFLVNYFFTKSKSVLGHLVENHISEQFGETNEFIQKEQSRTFVNNCYISNVIVSTKTPFVRILMYQIIFTEIKISEIFVIRILLSSSDYSINMLVWFFYVLCFHIH